MKTKCTSKPYPYESGAIKYRLSHNGALVLVGSEQECWSTILRESSCSVSWALNNEGWRMGAVK